MIFLENDYIKARFVAKGAELQSLQSKTTGIDYLWNADPTYWGKHSPILFPIVGGLKDGNYQYQGKTYQLSRHGFARDMEFTYQQLSSTELFFTLRDTEATLAVYPFKFNLGIRYQLSDHSLTCSYEIENPSQAELLFSIGAHPAFATPLQTDETYTDYYLEFNKDEVLHYHKVVNDLIADEVEEMNLNDRKLNLRHDLFYNDALVLKTLKSDCISLKNTKTSSALHFTFKDFPYFGIWAAKDAPFVCLEPWCGLADGEGHNQQLSDKEGIVTLPAGDTWQRSWQVEIE